jgi:hypothetical protein
MDSGMLATGEVNRVWERMVEAEVRSFYFAELASQFTKHKQIITGMSFFLTSGAAASLIAQAPTLIPILLSVSVALASAYSMAVGLDRRIKTLTQLHCEWNQLSAQYEHLWNHWGDDDATRILDELIKRGRDASEIATEMPYDEKLLGKWESRVYSRFKQAATA